VESRGPLLADRLYWRLREAITSGRLPGGARISERQVSADYGASRTPFREALQRLVSDRLVETPPREVAVVRTIDRKEALDLIDTCWVLGRRAVELAFGRISDIELDELAALARQASELATSDIPRAQQLSRSVHQRIYEASNNAELVRALGLLQPRIDLIAHLWYPSLVVGPAALTELEQRIEAHKRRDLTGLLALFDRAWSQVQAEVAARYDLGERRGELTIPG